MTILELITTLEQLQNKNLTVIGVVPNLKIELHARVVGNGFNSTKALIGIMERDLKSNSRCSNNKLLSQMKSFTDEEGEDDPPGETCWDKEVLLSFTENYVDGRSMNQCFPIESIELTKDTFGLVAGDEILSLRREFDSKHQ